MFASTRRLAVAVILLALTPPALDALLLDGAPGELAVPLTYRLEGWEAGGRYVGEVRYGGEAARCVVEHILPGLPAARPDRREALRDAHPPRWNGTHATGIPGADCLPWDLVGQETGRERLPTPVGARDAIATVARPVPGTVVAAWWDAATGILLHLEHRGSRTRETVTLTAANGSAGVPTFSWTGTARGDPLTGAPAHGTAFGMGLSGADEFREAQDRGLAPDLVMSYHWGLSSSDVTAVARYAGDLARETGTDVALHWYYWADRADRPCIEDGACRGRDVSVSDWHEETRVLARELARHLPPDRRAYVVVETEFNVATAPEDRAWWEGAFTRHMAEVARILRAEGGPRVHPATALGAWRFHEYDWFTGIYDAYDVPGVQTSGTRSPDANPECNDGEDYRGLFQEKTLASAQALHARTDKPLAVWDIFVASDGPDGEAEQARYFRDLREEIPRLAEANVRFVVQRALYDWVDAVPGCLGEGEKHLGLVDPRDGHAKPALHEFVLTTRGPATGARSEGESPRFASIGRPVFLGHYSEGAAWDLPAGGRLRWTLSVPGDGMYRLGVLAEGGALNVTLVGVHGRMTPGTAHLAWRDGGEVDLTGGEAYVVTVTAVDHARVDAVALESEGPRVIRRGDGGTGAGPFLDPVLDGVL